MTGVLVDFPLDEAQGVLAALDGEHKMSARETACATAGRTRLLQAVKVETGTGGMAAQSLAEVAEHLVGQRVRVATSYGSVVTGELKKLRGFRTVIIDSSDGPHPINLSLVNSLKVEKVAA